jgi:hypothetical protein
MSVKTYAETPTFSRMAAIATISAAVLNPKLYVHGATGCVSACAMALSNVVTCTCSVMPMDFRLFTSVCDRPREEIGIWEHGKALLVKCRFEEFERQRTITSTLVSRT